MKIHILKNQDLIKLSDIQLSEKDIHIWVICWKNISYWINKRKDILKESELKVANDFSFEEDKMRYIVGKILTRILAAYYLGANIEEICIEKDFYGKPFIVCNKEKELYHNISHSGEYVLLAFTYTGVVGIDVEKEKYFSEYKEIAKNFHEEEYLQICKLDNIHEFYKLWTAKEAYVKAVGKGLQINLNSFYVCKDEIYEEGEKSKAWDLFAFKAADKYPAALVINKKKEI